MTAALIDDSPPVLVASDRAHDAEAVARLLGDEFAKVHASTDPRRCVQDFELLSPGVLVLAFDSFEKSQRHLNRLREPAVLVHALAHKVIVLCGKDDVREVYEACKKQQVDDFVLFWPRSDEMRPLRMAVRRALAQVSSERGGSNGVRAVAAQARRVAACDGPLDDVGTGGTPGPLLDALRALGLLADRCPPFVLVIDDDRLQHKLLGQLLAPLKPECAYVTSAAQGMAELHRRRPDLILMDVSLPGVDGIEATRLLKSAAHFAAIPVVMITGIGGKAVVVDSLKAGAVDFIVKPFDRDSVVAKVRRVLYGKAEAAPAAAV